MDFSERSNPFNYKAHYNAKVKAYYAPLSQVVNIVQPEHGIIQVLYKNVYYTESFVVKKSDSIKIYFSPDTGYIQSKLLMNNQPISVDKEYQIDEDVSINAETALKAYTINITQTTGVILRVRKNNKEDHTTTFYANYNDILDIDYEIRQDGIDPIFTLNGETIKLPKSIIVSDDINIVATTEVSKVKVTLKQSSNSILKCIYNETEHLSDFIVNYGDKITPIINIDTGYHLTELTANNQIIPNNKEFVVLEDTTIESIVDINKYTVIIQQPEFAKITANYRGNNYESSFQINYADQASFVCTINSDVADKYYVRELLLNGQKIQQGTKYQFIDSGLVSADIAEVEIVKTYNISLPKVEGAIVYASYDNEIYTESFVAVEGYPITVWIEPEPQYNVTLFKYNGVSIPFQDRYVFNANENVTITASTKLKVYRMTLVNSTGGTLRAIMNGKEYTSDFDVVWGTNVTIYVDLNIAYNLTTITLNGTQIADGSTHVIKEDSEVKFTTALKRYEVKVIQPANGKITVNGSTGTSFTFTHGTEITVAITPDEGYKVKSFTMTDL